MMLAEQSSGTELYQPTNIFKKLSVSMLSNFTTNMICLTFSLRYTAEIKFNFYYLYVNCLSYLSLIITIMKYLAFL